MSLELQSCYPKVDWGGDRESPDRLKSGFVHCFLWAISIFTLKKKGSECQLKNLFSQ